MFEFGGVNDTYIFGLLKKTEMSQIGNLANAGSVTFNVDYLPQFFQVASVADAVTIDNLNIVFRGKTVVNLSDAAQIEALFKLENYGVLAASSLIANRLMLSDGKISGSCTITANNSAATTPAAYENSLGISSDGLIRNIVTVPVIANGNLEFTNFDVIYFLPTNVDYVLVEFENGYQETMTANEIEGLYVSQNPVEGSGLVNGFCVIDGLRGDVGQKVVSAKIFATGANVDVVSCNWQSV